MDSDLTPLGGNLYLLNSQSYKNVISKLLDYYAYTSYVGSITVRIYPAYSQGQICRDIC